MTEISKDYQLTAVPYEDEAPDWEGPSVLGSVDVGAAAAYMAVDLRCPVLNAQQEWGLGTAIQAGKHAAACLGELRYDEASAEKCAELEAQIEAGRHARRVLAAHNLRLVIEPALHFVEANVGNKHRLSLAEAIQNGNEGLMRAVDSFDPTKGRFSTIALPAIRGRMNYGERVEWRERVGLSKEEADTVNELRNIADRLAQEGKRVTYTAISEATGGEVSPKNVGVLLQRANLGDPISFDAEQEDDDESLAAIIADPQAEDPYQVFADRMEAEEGWSMLRRILDERSYTIVQMYLVQGLDQARIGEDVGLSRKRVGQLLQRAGTLISNRVGCKINLVELRQSQSAKAEHNRAYARRKKAERVERPGTVVEDAE